ncbi:MAG: extracellular solute-binding protein [Devosia sp.]
MTAMRLLLTSVIALSAGAALAQDIEGELVYATTGGLMEDSLTEHFYEPFEEETGVPVIPVAIEVPDQWARVEAMSRTGNMEFDIVTATPPDLITHADRLMSLNCTEMTEVVENGVDGACEEKGVMRTVGGMLIAYNTELFEKAPDGWADFWNVEAFPGPRGLPDTGDRDWWVPMVALLADGLAPEDLFPMDLDRAYAKLDEIRPHIAVWWKSGNQLQQIMRTNEVAMTMAYSGRVVAVTDEGFPWAPSWGEAVRDVGYMAVAEGAPNADAAIAFLNFYYQHADGHPDFIRTVKYGTGSATAAATMTDKERAGIATSAENYPKLVVADYQWIGDNRDMLRQRWNDWLTQ